MSAITANNSILDYEARTKSHSRHIRNYQKVSESNLDDASIISYLKSRHLTKTLTTFIMQSNSKKNIEPLLEVFLRGGKNYEGSIQSYCQAIKEAASKNNQSLTGKKIEDKKTKLIKLQLYIYIWYCIADNELDYARLNTLKLLIKSKGQILSEIPELLCYFALPYVDKGVINPVVKRIFSEQWRSEVRSLLEELIGVQTDSMEQQWFNIIVDMIEICQELIKNISIQTSRHNLKAMVERVKLYKTVVEKNKIELKDQITNQQKNGRSDIKNIFCLNFSNVKQIKANIQKLSESKYNESVVSTMTIYNKIQKEILEKSKIIVEKQYISQLIKHDILFLKDKSNHFYMEYQWFKLLKIMSSYHKCRDYLCKDIHIIKKIIEVTQNSYSNRDLMIKSQMFLIGIGIIQRVIVRQQLFQQVNKYDKIYEIMVFLIKKLELDFEKTTQNINIIENLLGCILGVVMHRKGRIKISKTSLFQVLVGILKRMQNMNNITGIQSLICSTIYLLLVQQHIRDSAIKLNLKDVLLSRLFEKKSNSYDTYVQYIIQRIERNEEQQEIDSDEDIQNDDQFDHNITIGDEVVILQKINSKASAKQSDSQPFRHVSNENQNIASNIQGGYARDRYSWKKKWLKQ